MSSRYLKLYEAVVTNDELTTKILNEIGYNAKGINELIEDGMIRRVRRGHYEFLASTHLYEYGKEMLSIDNAFAVNCVKKCYELNPTYLPALKFLLIGRLRRKEYTIAFKYLKEIIEIDRLQTSEYKSYLLLLSRLIKMPEEYVNLANSLTISDLHSRKELFSEEQQGEYDNILKLIFNYKHSLALKYIHKFEGKYGSLVYELKNYGFLLHSLAEDERNLVNNIKKSYEEKDYAKIVSVIKEYGEKHLLKDYYNSILFVAEDLVSINQTNLVPEAFMNNTQDYKVAIECRNYPLAYKLYNLNLEARDNALSENFLLQLLRDITILINKLSREQYCAYDQDRNLVAKEFANLLEDKPVALLPPMTSKRIDKIKKVLEGYQEISSFIIMDPEGYRLVLKIKPDIKKENINRGEFYRLGIEAYNSGDYKSCIKYISQLLRFGRPEANLYALVAFSYLKLDNVHEALDYLIISNYLSSLYNNGYDHSELIAKLKKTKVDKEFEVKPYFTMKEKDFEHEEDNYGVSDFESLNEYLVNSGLNVREACRNINMDDEQIDKVLLLYAKKYFIQGCYDKGEQFLRMYEKSPFKTEETIAIFNGIKRNKKIFVNQREDSGSILSLVLVP